MCGILISNQSILSFSNEHNQDAGANWKVSVIPPISGEAIQVRAVLLKQQRSLVKNFPQNNAPESQGRLWTTALNQVPINCWISLQYPVRHVSWQTANYSYSHNKKQQTYFNYTYSFKTWQEKKRKVSWLLLFTQELGSCGR